ncbi:MAG: hypothetical protein D6737_02860 [Chloroflexi bacterium]|nr:MAG: hypothetical protein D6737_02860 [Chloroflexota bacterium]
MLKHLARFLLVAILAAVGFSLFSIPVFAQNAVCTVTALEGGAVLRTGPSTVFETAGSLAGGESREVVQGDFDDLDQLWWQITAGSWVRADLVAESEGCATLGQSNGATAPGADPNDCVVTALEGGAVLRSGAGTVFETFGALGEGEGRVAIRGAFDETGFFWWRLSNGGWVREDLVSETAPCETIRAGDNATQSGPNADDVTNCVVTAIQNANLRARPSADADLTAALAPGESRVAIRQATGAEGFTWWRLSLGAWVREDLVSESPGCEVLRNNVPTGVEGVDDRVECVVTAFDGAILRGGASTDFEVFGALGAGESRVVLRAEVDQADQIWWRLTNGGWVREDLVDESQGCQPFFDFEAGTTGATDVDATMECVVTGFEGGAVLRSGPGTTFESTGALGANEARVALRGRRDEGGQTWWRLTNGGWVREDLVSESPGCSLIEVTG